MADTSPLIQEIRDRFDHFGETVGNRLITSSIKVESTWEGYSVTSYPDNTYGFEGFTTDIRVPEGVFGEEGPTRVEISRENDGIMRFTTGEVSTDENGLSTASIHLEPRVAREGLLLPGDPGFELFEQLHSELVTRRTVIADVLGSIGLDIDPKVLKYISQTISAGRYDHDKGIATHERSTLLEVGGVDASAMDTVHTRIKLDGSLTAPFQTGQPVEYPPLDPMVFRAGQARVDWERSWKHESPEVGDEALLAFAGLHASFAALYR